MLVFHKITTRHEIGINAFSPERFRSCIQYLADNGYRASTFRDLLEDTSCPSKPVILTFDDGYECIYESAFPVMRRVGFPGVVFVVSGFIGRYNDWDVNPGGTRFPHLNKEQIRELNDAGWEIGSHTMNHVALPFLNTRMMRRELSVSRTVLKNLTGREVKTIAYPFGLYNPRVIEAAKRAGYMFGCRNVSFESNRNDLLKIPRVPLNQGRGIKTIQKFMANGGLKGATRLKLIVTGWPAIFSPIYQILFRRYLFLEK
ncbi:MAG: polysaccharide deacetylase family protein [Calditrichia bacterium]